MTIDLFGKKPRRPRQIKAHVSDAGHGVIFFTCKKCNWNSGWVSWDRSVTEAKKGIPCEKCNPKKVLHLHLNFEYFDAIAAGKKTEEYRLAEKWKDKLDRENHTHIRLYRGFEKVSDGTVIDRPYRGYELMMKTHKHFGAHSVLVCAIDVRGAEMATAPKGRC